VKKSHTGDLHTGLSLGFRATGLESATSSAEVVKVVSSVEVMVEVVIVASNDNNDDGEAHVQILVCYK